ncbi:fungal-specific transcription factor domain-containing protein [Fusarium redolens]|uniref:Fungal-specific transcription factor domain-containing protein n=1 Tax=Fusarium redolens TaxID=48865 RepID=A0A9P9GYR0_FUSRE|nr:fungal-specific transcription factor domain-containing protein [Fusarium redolens]KAH7247277.1 fungal-specific transcription factor domain-containing protein [Fusarium redolens]
MTPFPSGCWTCKLRHRKCDLRTPVCGECKDRCIPCHGYGPKPVWMDGSAAEKQKLIRIKKAVKRNAQDLRRAKKSNRQAVREATPTARQSPPQTSLAQDATSLSSPSQPGHVADHGSLGLRHSNSPERLHLGLERTQSSVQDETSPQASLSSEHSTPSCVLRPELASLIMYYLDHVFCWQFPYFSPRSRLGNRGWLLLFLSNGGSLSHAALALSALHRNALQVSRQQGYLHNQEAFEYYSRALRELCEFSRRTETETLLSDKPKLAEFVAASMTLISFQVFNGAEYDWLPHLDAVMTVLSMNSPEALLRNSSSSDNTLTSPVSMNCENSGEESQPDFDFLVTQALWYDILACASTGRVPRIPYQQWLEGSDLDMADLMGCYNWVMIAIGDLAHLQAWKKDMKEQGTLSVPELVMKSRNIETRLQNGIVELELADKGDTEIPQATWVSHIFALASLVLSSTIVSGPWASLPEVKETVAKAVDVLRGWPRAIPLQGLVWPLYIIGCMADAEQQGFFESLLTNLIKECGGFGNSGTVLKIMKSCWALQHRNRNGAELVLQTGGRVLLI